MDDSDRPSWLGLLFCCAIVFAVAYSWGASSKTPYISSLNQKIVTQQAEITSLNKQLSDNTTTTVPDTDTLENFAPKTNTTCAITLCNDGTCSDSTGRGTCSHHGGEAD